MRKLILKVVRYNLIALVCGFVSIGITSCNSKDGKGNDNNLIYYVSKDGNDTNSGLTPSKPWATLKKVNSTHFSPGSKILFKSGDEWFGQLEINSSGAKDSLIVFDKYGNGEKPKIQGQGEKRYALLIKNVSYCTVKNLEVTNEGKEPAPKRTGVLVEAINYGDSKEISINNLEVHHVNGSLVKKDGGGSAIFWHNGGDEIKSRFIGLSIENCFLHHCGRNGITSSGYSNRDNWHPSLGVVIRNNLLEQIPGDGIVPIATDGAIIEYNIMRDCPDVLSHEEAAAGIWPWSADNTLIQYNEVSGHKAKWDGQGFDSDYNCNNTIIQYNYSHDNYGGFLLLCNDGSSLGKKYNKGTLNSIIRYNVSINDGIRTYPTKREGKFSPTIHITGPVQNSKIYGNIIINDLKRGNNIDNTIIKMDNWGLKWPEKTSIFGNLFLFSDEAKFSFAGVESTYFSDNYLTSKIDSESYQSLGNKVLQFSSFNLDKFRWEMLNNNNRVNKEFISEWLNSLE